MRKERRIIQSSIELRTDGENERVVGYGARFNELSELIYGLFYEKIAPGAFRNAILISDTRGLFNHDPNLILGRKSAGTLELLEDDVGLWYDILSGNRSYEKDLKESLRRKDITQSSFGFEVGKQEWDESGDIPIRTIIEVDYLYDVSPVTFPAYPSTSSGMRSLNSEDEAKKVFEEYQKSRSKSGLDILRRRLELSKKFI